MLPVRNAPRHGHLVERKEVVVEVQDGLCPDRIREREREGGLTRARRAADPEDAATIRPVPLAPPRSRNRDYCALDSTDGIIDSARFSASIAPLTAATRTGIGSKAIRPEARSNSIASAS